MSYLFRGNSASVGQTVVHESQGCWFDSWFLLMLRCSASSSIIYVQLSKKNLSSELSEVLLLVWS